MDTERALAMAAEADEAKRLKSLGDKGMCSEVMELAVDYFESAKHADGVVHWMPEVANPVLVNKFTSPKFVADLTAKCALRGSGCVGVLMELCKGLICCDYARARELEHGFPDPAKPPSPKKAHALKKHGLYSIAREPSETLVTRTCRQTFKRFVRTCVSLAPIVQPGQRVDPVSDVPVATLPRLVQFLWKRLHFYRDSVNAKQNLPPLVVENAFTMLMALWVELTQERSIGIMEPEEILRDVLAALESWVVGVFAPAETCLRGVKTAELFVRKMIEFDPEVVKGATYARVRDVILEGQLRYQIKAGYWAHLRTSTKRSPLPTPLIDPPKLDQRAIMCAESRGVPIDPIRSTSYSAKTPPGWVKVGSSLVRPWSKDERNKVNQAMFREMMMQENALTIKVRTDFEPEHFTEADNQEEWDTHLSKAERMGHLFKELTENDMREFSASLIQRRFIEHGLIARKDKHDLTVEALYRKYEGVGVRRAASSAEEAPSAEGAPSTSRAKSIPMTPALEAHQKSAEKSRNLVGDLRYMRSLAVDQW